MEIGNPADKNKPGNAIISGYITTGTLRSQQQGNCFRSETLSRNNNQCIWIYTLTLPGYASDTIFIVGMKEKKVNMNLFGTGEMNIQMNSVLIP